MTLLMRDKENQEIGRAEGRIEGRSEGEYRKLILQVCKKLQKNCSIPQIAEALEEEESNITKICKIAEKHKPEYDVDKIYAELEERNDIV